jgi:hypothetical protein
MVCAGENDQHLEDDAVLLRRVRPDQIVDDQNLGARRPSSAPFKDTQMSVDAEPILKSLGLDKSFSLSKHKGYSLVGFTAGVARAHQQAVVVTPEDGNPAHTEVRGKKTQGIANALRDVSSWVHLEPK